MAERGSHLRVAAPDEKPPAKRSHKSISEAVEKGDGRDVLAAMRKALAKKLDDGDIASNAIASAYKELRELDRLIRAADAESDDDGTGTDDVDDTYDASAV